jgi:type VI secretion system secreted protein Hcp
MIASPGDAVAADVFLAVTTKRAGAVKGEGVAKGHQAEIGVTGFHFGVSASSAVGSGQATSRRQYETLTVVKRLDSATTPLLSALATNDEVRQAKLSLRKPGDGQDDFFTITVSNARVTSVAIDCDEGGNAVERVEIAFTKIDVAYRVQTALGIAGATSTFSDEFVVG